MQGNGFVSVSGTGTITGNGFDPTPGTWTFTTQNPPANGVFSFSASTTAVPSPTPTPTATSTPAMGSPSRTQRRSRSLITEWPRPILRISWSPVMPGAVTKVTVKLNDITYANPTDIDMLLIGPVGQTAMIMSDAGRCFLVSLMYAHAG